jgi:hypothetical protein
MGGGGLGGAEVDSGRGSRGHALKFSGRDFKRDLKLTDTHAEVTMMGSRAAAAQQRVWSAEVAGLQEETAQDQESEDRQHPAGGQAPNSGAEPSAHGNTARPATSTPHAERVLAARERGDASAQRRNARSEDVGEAKVGVSGEVSRISRSGRVLKRSRRWEPSAESEELEGAQSAAVEGLDEGTSMSLSHSTLADMPEKLSASFDTLSGQTLRGQGVGVGKHFASKESECHVEGEVLGHYIGGKGSEHSSDSEEEAAESEHFHRKMRRIMPGTPSLRIPTCGMEPAQGGQPIAISQLRPSAFKNKATENSHGCSGGDAGDFGGVFADANAEISGENRESPSLHNLFSMSAAGSCCCAHRACMNL